MGAIIEYENVEIERADRLVMKNVTFSIEEGSSATCREKVGSSKSSLMKTMYAEVEIPRGDRAEVLGFDLLNLRRRDIPMLRRKVGDRIPGLPVASGQVRRPPISGLCSPPRGGSRRATWMTA